MLLTKYDNQRTGISVIHLFHALAYFFFFFYYKTNVHVELN